MKLHTISYVVMYMYSCKNTFGIKKVQPSKVESYLEGNAWTDWQQEDMISEYSQGLEY